MTDRIKGLVVTLSANVRADDVEPIVNAIAQLRGVYSVSPLVADVDHHIAVEQARREIESRILEALRK